MKWLIRLGVAVLILAVMGGGAYWFYIADGAVPAAAAYKTDGARW